MCGTCRNCRAGRRQMCIRTKGLGVQRDGAFAEFLTLPGANVWVHHGSVDPERRGAVRPPRQRRAHRARVPGRRRGRAGHRLRADRADGDRRRPARRCPLRRRHGRQRDPARDGHGRWAPTWPSTSDDRGPGPRRRRPWGAAPLGMREGFDVGFEMSGAPTALPSMVANMNHGGRIAMLGLPSSAIAVDWGLVVTHMLTVKGIYGREMFETWQTMSSMLQTSSTLRDRIGSLVTAQVPGECVGAGVRRGGERQAAARSSSTGRRSRCTARSRTTWRASSPASRQRD